MAGNGLEPEPEQLIEIVDSTNNFIGYVSGTLPNAVADDNIVIFDHMDGNHDDSEYDSDKLSIQPDATPDIPVDNTLSSQESTYDETDTYEIIDELINEDNEPATPAIAIVNYSGNVENADDYANGWEWQLEDKGSSCGPFLLDLKLNIQSNATQPETFLKHCLTHQCG